MKGFGEVCPNIAADLMSAWSLTRLCVGSNICLQANHHPITEICCFYPFMVAIPGYKMEPLKRGRSNMKAQGAWGTKHNPDTK